MRSLLVLLAFGSVALAPVSGHAAITVTIKDGNAVIRTLTAPTAAGQNTTLPLLTCAAPPCSQTIGNFVFEDISAASRARVIKTDGASVDKIELKGVRIRSQVNGRTLKIEYKTADGDLTPLPGNLYPYTATMLGSFVAATGTGAATGCTNPNRTFCARLEVKAQGNTVNLAGSETLASVSVPPISTLSGSLPAGLSDSETIDCGTQGVAGSCRPQLTATLTVFFALKGETLTLPGSAITGNANRATQDEGAVDNCAEISEMGCQDTFVVHTAADQNLKAVPTAPRPGTEVRAGRSVAVQFELHRPTQTVAAESLTLLALDPGAAGLSTGDQAAASRSFLAFVPSPIRPAALKTLIFDYDVIVDGQFSDCVDGSLRVEITFARDELVEGPIVILLGSAPGFDTDCRLAGLSGVNLLKNRELRADATAMGSNCCDAPCCVLGRVGGLDKRRVRSVSFILEGRAGIDQKVVLRRAQVNDFVFTPTASVDFARSCELPADGRSIRISKPADPGQEFVVGDEDIRGSGCSLGARVNTDLLAPAPGVITTYRAELCVSGRCLRDFVEFDVRGE
jgi:hypothetical protein